MVLFKKHLIDNTVVNAFSRILSFKVSMFVPVLPILAIPKINSF